MFACVCKYVVLSFRLMLSKALNYGLRYQVFSLLNSLLGRALGRGYLVLTNNLNNDRIKNTKFGRDGLNRKPIFILFLKLTIVVRDVCKTINMITVITGRIHMCI